MKSEEIEKRKTKAFNLINNTLNHHGFFINPKHYEEMSTGSRYSCDYIKDSNTNIIIQVNFFPGADGRIIIGGTNVAISALKAYEGMLASNLLRAYRGF